MLKGIGKLSENAQNPWAILNGWWRAVVGNAQIKLISAQQMFLLAGCNEYLGNETIILEETR
jgi:hypothetical protein